MGYVFKVVLLGELGWGEGLRHPSPPVAVFSLHGDALWSLSSKGYAKWKAIARQCGVTGQEWGRPLHFCSLHELISIETNLFSDIVTRHGIRLCHHLTLIHFPSVLRFCHIIPDQP